MVKEIELGLIGFPLKHSYSSRLFNNKFKDLGITGSYSLFELNGLNEFPELIRSNPSLSGLNVTIPYKEKIIPFLNELSDEALKIGAVNTIKIRNIDGKVFLKGFNTDCFGFEESIVNILDPQINKALVLGYGGAAKAILYVLNKLNIVPTIVTRDITKIESHFKEKYNFIEYKDITYSLIQDNRLIINCTPLGMFPNTDCFPDIPYSFLSSEHICYDLIYNPEQTEFLKRSARYGAMVKNGLDMLHLQAERAWQIWIQS